MADWYYKSMGAEVGPVSNKEMLELVRKGEVTPDTEVRKNDSKWYLASKVGGLMEQAQAGTVEQVCPYCGHLVARPPAKCDGCARWVTLAVDRTKGKTETPSGGAGSKSPGDIREALKSVGEDFVDLDEGGAKYALMTFAISFVGVLFVFTYMVVGKRWTRPWWIALAAFGVVCSFSLMLGAWLRRRAFRRAMGS